MPGSPAHLSARPIEQSSSLVSQLSPYHPIVHWQAYVPTPIVPTADESPHVPPFWHGADAHSPPAKPDGTDASGSGVGVAGTAGASQQQLDVRNAEHRGIVASIGVHWIAIGGHAAAAPPLDDDGSAPGSADGPAPGPPSASQV